MLDVLGREFRQIWKALDDNQRRTAAAIMPGVVAEIDGKRIRVELGPEDPRTGKKFLSPWVQMQESASTQSASTSNIPVAVGDPVRLLSPNGELGPHSLAVRDSHTDDAPNPAGEDNELVIAFGGCALRMRDGLLTIEQGSARFEIANGDAKVVSNTWHHNAKNVGDTHKHTGVIPGPSNTGPPS